MADELKPILQTRNSAPLHLLNIGGGAAPDSMNALFLIQKDDPKLLQDRRVVIHILDIDRAGANFAARALEALQSEGAPLHGIAVESRFVEYDWSDATRMQAIWRDIPGVVVVAGSSEGGMFEYGSEEQILANLKALHECSPHDFVMSGSVLHDENSVDANLRLLMKSSTLAVHPLGIARLKSIAQSAG
jgi:hypothetical protein